ncbi:fumarylacetoacetate hydrolase family protein [Pacificimonas sp. ICDLI1SI03]
MKLVSFRHDCGAHVGSIDGQDIVVLTGPGWTGAPTLGGIFSDGQIDALQQRAAVSEWRLPLDSIEYMPAVFDPPRVFCVGVNYEEHRLETARDRAPAPIIFLRTVQSQAAHGATISIPPVSTKIDYEGEIAVVIGKGGRQIERATAMEHVWAYSAYNDISVRDWQTHTQQWTPGKNFDGSGPFGPWLVTSDEMPSNVEDIRLETRLNGQVVQSGHAGQMIFSIAEQIEYISTFTELLPGDVIVTGTPGGVGVKRDPQIFMKSGDLVEVEVTGVGVLSNVID